ncbi:MAG: hypothetical protein E7111_03585 [Bacteroidales bacterium]|nr:hypothetical protein [Bacteroidales bacterium]
MKGLTDVSLRYECRYGRDADTFMAAVGRTGPREHNHLKVTGATGLHTGVYALRFISSPGMLMTAASAMLMVRMDVLT